MPGFRDLSVSAGPSSWDVPPPSPPPPTRLPPSLFIYWIALMAPFNHTYYSLAYTSQRPGLRAFQHTDLTPASSQFLAHTGGSKKCQRAKKEIT